MTQTAGGTLLNSECSLRVIAYRKIKRTFCGAFTETSLIKYFEFCLHRLNLDLADMSLESIPLNNGYRIPAFGLGTYTGDGAENTVKAAIDVGYRLLDTAFFYRNEIAVGKALKRVFAENKLKRDDIFVVSKLPNTKHQPSDVLPTIKRSLQDLQLDYVDLYLIHWPIAIKAEDEYDSFNSPEDLNVTIEDTWRAMEDLVKQGYTKSIGLSNFNSQQISRILKIATIKPVVNQVECNPYLSQEKLREFCKSNDIQIMAYSPLYAPHRPEMETRDLNLLKEPIVEELARKYKKSAPQIVLKYLTQCGVIPIPKTEKVDRLKSNFDIQDFTIEAEDFEKMRSLNNNRRCTPCLEARIFKEYPFHIEF